jgi:hypothetical protein
MLEPIDTEQYLCGLNPRQHEGQLLRLAESLAAHPVLSAASYPPAPNRLPAAADHLPTRRQP